MGPMDPKLSIMPTLPRSASMASAMPSCCTFTATSRPSSSVARCTWPMEALASASSSKERKRRSMGPPSSSSTVRRIDSAVDVGAAERSFVNAVS
jgi:hypothetical protein